MGSAIIPAFVYLRYPDIGGSDRPLDRTQAVVAVLVTHRSRTHRRRCDHSHARHLVGAEGSDPRRHCWFVESQRRNGGLGLNFG